MKRNAKTVKIFKCENAVNTNSQTGTCTFLLSDSTFVPFNTGTPEYVLFITFYPKGKIIMFSYLLSLYV